MYCHCIDWTRFVTRKTTENNNIIGHVGAWFYIYKWKEEGVKLLRD